jgi:hypothetical protein
MKTTARKFQAAESNKFGMKGLFTRIVHKGEFLTVFTPSCSPEEFRAFVVICQHENLDQAKWMAEEFNKFSSVM